MYAFYGVINVKPAYVRALQEATVSSTGEVNAVF